MAEDSEDVSRNSGNNRRTQCGPDNDDQTPAVNAGLQTPAVNAGLQTPAVHATVNVNMSKQLETQLSAVSSHDRSVLLYLCLFNLIPINLKAARTVYQPFQA